MPYSDDSRTGAINMPLAQKDGGTSPTCAGEPRIEALKYSDIPRTVEGSHRAFWHDSVMQYYRDADRSPRLYDLRDKLYIALRLGDTVFLRRAVTVGHGDSILYYGVPGNNKPGPICPWMLPLLRLAEPVELQKRREEFTEKLKAAIQDAFGEELENMLEIQGLATAPEKQGRGYATALVRMITDMADAQGRATFVISSDAYGFYEPFGFKVVRQVLLGVDNPKWCGEPVHIYIMSRDLGLRSKAQEAGATEPAKDS